MDLFDYFINNTGKKITKWTHYFPVYEKHFKALTEKPINILEIGVLNGGSLQMWKEYFHPDCIDKYLIIHKNYCRAGHKIAKYEHVL